MQCNIIFYLNFRKLIDIQYSLEGYKKPFKRVFNLFLDLTFRKRKRVSHSASLRQTLSSVSNLTFRQWDLRLNSTAIITSKEVRTGSKIIYRHVLVVLLRTLCCNKKPHCETPLFWSTSMKEQLFFMKGLVNNNIY